MKIKTLVAGSPQEIDKLCNELDKTLKVKFTQTCVGYNVAGSPMTFRATVFYED